MSKWIEPFSDHPDVILAKAHRAQMQRYAELREREPDPLPELHKAVRELALIVAEFIDVTLYDDDNTDARRDALALAERASVLARLLA